MDSPVQIPFKSFIQFNADDPSPRYVQIVFGFIKAIQLGLLPEGTKLPGTRILCRLLEVNRNTLIKALHDLELQGFIEISPNKGTFILSNQRKPGRDHSHPAKAVAKPIIDFTFKRSSILESPLEKNDLTLQFNDGLPDERLNDTGTIAKLYVSALKNQNRKIRLGYSRDEVHENFKKQLSNYLNLTRGLRITAGNLITTSNHQLGLYLVLKLLVNPGDRVVVASPGYYASNMTILDSGAQIISVPVDNDGICTSYLKEICEKKRIRLVYLNSVYHYPTTVSLSAKRRIEILELAANYGFVIIEDDYEFDFHFDNNPILPLAAMDTNNRVVYVGSFDRSLPTGFGCGFISCEPTLIAELEKHLQVVENGSDVMKEQTLTNWIVDGDVHRLLKKNKKMYKARRDHFARLLSEKLDNYIDFTVPSRGLAIWVKWKQQINLIKLREKCAEHGLFLPKIILYQSKDLTATRLGFGSLNVLELAQAVEVLRKSLSELVV